MGKVTGRPVLWTTYKSGGHMKKAFLLVVVLAVVAIAATVFVLVVREKANGKKITLDANYSAQYVFPEKPKLGTSILKVTVFGKSGEKVGDLALSASYDMPSMRGHHAFGPAPVAVNKNSDYLLPVHFAMPGDWEIVLKFQKNGELIHTETILLDL